MKTIPTLKNSMVEKCLKTVWQSLPVILLTILLSNISIFYASADKNEKSSVEHHPIPAAPFQVEQEAPVQPTIEWDKTIGGGNNDLLSIIIPTVDGGYLLAGSSESDASGDKSEDNKSDQSHQNDFWIVKIDADRNKVWDKTFGGNADDRFTSALPTPDGGYLLAGSSESDASGDKSENNKGEDHDYWIIKIDAEGNKVWDKTFGGNSHDELTSALLTPDGGYLLAGSSNSDVSGDKSEDSKGFEDYWVVKIDAEGTKVWDKTFGGERNDYRPSAVPTSDGGYLLAGISRSDVSGDKSENSRGFYDYWVVKIDAEGTKVWDKTFGGEEADVVNDALPTPDGGYLLAGTSSSDASVDKSEDNISEVLIDDYWVIKIDADGNKVWDNTIGGENNDYLLNVVPTPNGGYLLAGSSESDVSGDKSENSKGVGDYWVVKIDADGTKVWDKTIGGNSYDNILSVTPTPDGNYLIGGASYSNISGDKSENSKGDADYWIVKLKDDTTTEVTSLMIVDAKTDQNVRELRDEDTVYLAEVRSGLINIRANTSGGPINYVKFELNGPITHMQTEREFPYALFGDHPTGDFKSRIWLPGNYTLSVTPYTQDKKGSTFTISFEVTDVFAITEFTLINAKFDKEEGELSEGDVIDVASFRNYPLNIRADTKPMHVGKVTFSLEGPIMYSNTEQNYPYTLFDDVPAPDGYPDYKGLRLTPGAYILTATPYALDSMGVASTITFTVIDSESSASEARSLQAAVYPVPTSGVINISHEGGGEDAHMMLLDFSGKMLLQQPLHQQAVEQVDLRAFKKGVYYLKIVSPEAVQVFRVVKE